MITRSEADKIVQALDVSWQDVPLRQETLAVWVGELCGKEHVFEFDDCAEAVRYLLLTATRRPSLSEFVAEAKAQRKIRVNSSFAPSMPELIA